MTRLLVRAARTRSAREARWGYRHGEKELRKLDDPASPACSRVNSKAIRARPAID